MTKVSDVSGYLANRIPPELKEDYDNVGLLCGFPDREVNRILVALDVDLDTIKEAEKSGAELIVAHHPVIFTPLRSVLNDDPTGRRVIRLIQSGISAVCMHTNLDHLEGGVNTALARAVGAEIVEMLDMGSVCRLINGAAAFEAFLKTVNTALSASDLRFHDAKRPVERIAVCGGAGGDIIYYAVRMGCDTVLTGEIKHHQWLDGREMGLNLIEAGHFATENVVLTELADMLSEGFPGMEIILSAQSSPTRGL